MSDRHHDGSISVTHWIGELRQGSREAQERIFAKYFGPATRVAERRLGGLPRREADEEDVALSALQSFFAGVADGRFERIAGRDDLWSLLAVITARKAVRQTRRMFRKKRGGAAVRGESVFAAQEGRAGLAEAAAGADERREAEARDTLRWLLSRLPDESLVAIAKLKLQGLTHEEIAEELGVVPRTIERKVARIRELWVAAEGDDSGESTNE